MSFRLYGWFLQATEQSQKKGLMARRLCPLNMRVLPLLFLLPAAVMALDFTREVQPILAEHCLECHGPDDAKGGLVLSTQALAGKLLKSGKRALVPGSPKDSEMLARIAHPDPQERMPPAPKRAVSAKELELLRQWIAQGAGYEAHWAFRPLAKVQPPSGGHPIDAFIGEGLQKAGLKPSPRADRHSLIKRACYDLLGLPPTAEQVREFLADTSPQAFDHLLDRLLQSPHFGERWGRHWLDAARYADSDGYEKDRPRPDAWRYRDWVIEAVNHDLPLDQFAIQQIAGDLLPKADANALLATAFHRQTLTNTEGGTDQEQFRIEAVMDRTETIGAVWMGLTVGCARCHTHKYDPITQREYYQLFAYFNNADESTREVPISTQAWSQYQAAHGPQARALEGLQRRLEEAKANLPARLPAWEAALEAQQLKAQQTKAQSRFEALPSTKAQSPAGAWKSRGDGWWQVPASKANKGQESWSLEVEAPAAGLHSLRLEWRTAATAKAKAAPRLLEVELLPQQGVGAGAPWPMHSASASSEAKDSLPASLIDGNPGSGWKPATQAHWQAHLGLPIKGSARLQLRIVVDAAASRGAAGELRLLGSSVATEQSLAPADIFKLLTEEPKRRNPVVIAPLWTWMQRVDSEVMAAADALRQASAKLPKPPLMEVRVISQRREKARSTHRLERGDFLQPAEAVQPGSLAALPGKAGSSRLDFARWLVSNDNPLTRRVMVNQLWAHLFGEGIVSTLGDFGVRGSPPSHPQLLDWLAGELSAQGWSRKAMLRLIMQSATYQQQSVQREDGQARDPKNSLLWRQNRLRVEGEIVRDLALAASGLLSPKIGGPSVFPPMPADIAALSYANNFSWKTSEGEDRHRRGMYTFFKRTAPHPELTTFDCPDANLTSIKRGVSNTPLQALTTLNAEAYAEAAQALALRALREPGDDQARLRRLWQFCLPRPATAQEVATLSELLQQGRRLYQRAPTEAQTAIRLHRAASVASAENAAWVGVARTVLNLDEFITRD